MTYTYIEYPALVYKNPKGNTFIANCITKKLVGYGHTEIDAIRNLERVLQKTVDEYDVRVKAVSRYLPCLG